MADDKTENKTVNVKLPQLDKLIEELKKTRKVIEKSNRK